MQIFLMREERITRHHHHHLRHPSCDICEKPHETLTRPNTDKMRKLFEIVINVVFGVTFTPASSFHHFAVDCFLLRQQCKYIIFRAGNGPHLQFSVGSKSCLCSHTMLSCISREVEATVRGGLELWGSRGERTTTSRTWG